MLQACASAGRRSLPAFMHKLTAAHLATYYFFDKEKISFFAGYAGRVIEGSS
jgi:hypothetical protein